MGATRLAEPLTLRPCARCVKYCRRRVHVDRLGRARSSTYRGEGRPCRASADGRTIRGPEQVTQTCASVRECPLALS
jgi:hypothetical protein